MRQSKTNKDKEREEENQWEINLENPEREKNERKTGSM